MSNHELDAAGIDDPDLRAAFRTSGRILRRQRRGEQHARYLFPAAKRPHLDACWGVLAHLTDIADGFEHSPAVRALRLDEWQVAFSCALDGVPDLTETSSSTTDQRADTALAEAFVHFLHTWKVPADSVPAFLAGQRRALWVEEFRTRAELDDYLTAVALPPALWLNALLETISPEADYLCSEAARAFRLIDFLWDIRADLDAGRLHLPEESLRQFGIDRERLHYEVGSGRASKAVRRLMRYEIDCARNHLDIGSAWPDTLHATSRTFAQTEVRRRYRMLEHLERAECEFFADPGMERKRLALNTIGAALVAVTKAQVINHRNGRGRMLSLTCLSEAVRERGKR
ncbi:phytoene/squalene synthase family protein [Nocardia huaxiensis]|uniref:Squalene/phytoene synthase family protein n=1 Tax=Nocardia huaxiensis TaxID=2755382 RepID=A0A7D6ZH50_9NOCA|nr:squalene/phytoene synthase family protein [Nocardia huaxiensis]QLY33578.1 squalene/phytoene synthase family protein [Nocardia huaxiensis]UFS99504.1 squalene/phytoene synthase family protein [Nocardia huaxiensis]